MYLSGIASNIMNNISFILQYLNQNLISWGGDWGFEFSWITNATDIDVDNITTPSG